MISAEALNEIKEAMSTQVAISRMQADSSISIQRKADVSELKAERALADKDEKKAGVHTQMEMLKEALYDLGGCDGLVDQCVEGEGAEKSFAPMSELSVQKLHGKLKVVRIVLDKRLVALGIADGAPTMQNDWRACGIWNVGEEVCEGVKPSKEKKRKLYTETAQSIETDNKSRKVPYAGGGWKHQNSEASQDSQSYHSNSMMRPGAASGGMAFSGGRPIPPHKGWTEPCIRCGKVGHWVKECQLLYGTYTDLGKDKMWVHAAVGPPYPDVCALSA